jgi:pilus assembly protein CpaE
VSAPAPGQILCILLVSPRADVRDEVDEALGSLSGRYELHWISQADLAVTRAQDLHPQVVLIDSELGSQTALALIRQFSARLPRAAAVALVGKDDLRQAQEAMVSGARGFIATPVRGQELVAVLRQAMGQRALGQLSERIGLEPGQLVVFCGPKGGTGRTTLAVNTAVSLVELQHQANANLRSPLSIRRGRFPPRGAPPLLSGSEEETLLDSVVLLDADYAAPAVDVALDLHPERTAADLVPRMARLDRTLIESILVGHPSGLQVLLAPPPGDLPPQFSLPQLQQLLTWLKRMFAWVVIDLGLPFGEQAFGFLDAANRIIISVMPELIGLRNARLLLDQCAARGYADAKIWLVINRSDMAGGLNAADIEQRLGRKIRCKIPDDQALATDTMNRGVPMVLTHPRSSVSRAYRGLARELTAERDAAPVVAGPPLKLAPQPALTGNAPQTTGSAASRGGPPAVTTAAAHAEANSPGLTGESMGPALATEVMWLAPLTEATMPAPSSEIAPPAPSAEAAIPALSTEAATSSRPGEPALPASPAVATMPMLLPEAALPASSAEAAIPALSAEAETSSPPTEPAWPAPPAVATMPMLLPEAALPASSAEAAIPALSAEAETSSPPGEPALPASPAVATISVLPPEAALPASSAEASAELPSVEATASLSPLEAMALEPATESTKPAFPAGVTIAPLSSDAAPALETTGQPAQFLGKPAGDGKSALAMPGILEIAGSSLSPQEAGVVTTAPKRSDGAGTRRPGIFSDEVLLLAQIFFEIVIVTAVAVIVLRHPLSLGLFRSGGGPVGSDVTSTPELGVGLALDPTPTPAVIVLAVSATYARLQPTAAAGTATLQAINTRIPASTDTSPPGATPSPARTAVPTETSTRTAVPTTPAPMSTATSSPAAEPSLTSTSAPVAPLQFSVSPVPSPSRTSTPSYDQLRPTLVAPEPNAPTSGVVQFSWQPAGVPPPGTGYEVVWWNPGEDPATARGIAAPTAGSNLSANLRVLYSSGQMTSSRLYWTVLIVQLSPYVRLTQPANSNAWVLVYQPPTGGGGGSSSAPPRPR